MSGVITFLSLLVPCLSFFSCTVPSLLCSQSLSIFGLQFYNFQNVLIIFTLIKLPPYAPDKHSGGYLLFFISFNLLTIVCGKVQHIAFVQCVFRIQTGVMNA